MPNFMLRNHFFDAPIEHAAAQTLVTREVIVTS